MMTMLESPVSARGRPLGFDRETALKAATASFWQHGYEATLISTLESATGLARSSITNTFGTKHDLLLACLDSYLDILDETLLRPLHSPDIEGAGALLGFFSSLESLKFTEPGSHGCLMVNTATELSGRDPDIAPRTNRYLQLLRDGFDAALGRARADGALGRAPDDAAHVLVALAITVNFVARADHGISEASRTTAAAQSLIESWRTADAR